MRSALLLAAALAACSGPKTAAPPAKVTSPSTDCPATAPAHGSACGRYLTKCSYPDEPRCPTAHCADVASHLVWQTSLDQCPIACPATKPVAGTSCSPVTFQSCHYQGGEKCGYQLHCAATGWVEEELTLCDGM